MCRIPALDHLRIQQGGTKMTIAQKILKAHLVDGEMAPGQEIGLKIDQTLT